MTKIRVGAPDASGERLLLDLDVDEGCCGVCAKEPANERLILEILVDDEEVRTAIVCRHCLSEYAPELLAVIEEEAGQS